MRLEDSVLPAFVENPDPYLYLKDDYVVLDWETTNLEKGSPINPDNKIVLGCWTVVKDGTRTKKFVFGGEDQYSELLEDISQAEFLVAHNVKFELGWLLRCGYDLSSKPVYCTQIGEYVIAGNRPWRLNLEACLKRRRMGGKMSIVSKMIAGGVCPSTIPEHWLLKYCQIDVDQCERLFLHQRNYHQKYGLSAVMYSRCLFTPVLADIERRGMQLDKERVTKLFNDSCKEMQALDIQLQRYDGGINWRSGPQVANFLFKELKFKIPRDHRGKELLGQPTKDWPEGIPKVDKEALGKLKPTNKRQREFIELYKTKGKVYKRHETLEKLKACCDEADGILYFSYNQTRTATHRLSSTGARYKVQGQNFARDLKPLIRSRNEGWPFEEDDSSQLEYRFAVDYAGDKAGLQDIINGEDVHFLSASTMFPEYLDLPDGLEKKELRTAAKADTFKPLYYGKSGTPAQMRYYEAFRKKHVQISQLHEEIIEYVVQHKQYRTFSGLVFYWPLCKRSSTGFASFSNQICNYFCQNGATAEVIPLGVLCMWHRMHSLNLQSFMVNTVHDSVETEVHPEETELIPKIAHHALCTDSVDMLDKLYGYKFTVPLDSESESGTHWSNSTYWEEKYLAV